MLKKRKGFTLIELVIVIAILVVLIAIAVPKYQKSNLTAQATAHNANVKVLKNAAMLYFVENPEATTISEENLRPYLEGKFPKPAKSLGVNSFSISITEGEVVISPGEVKIEDKSIVSDEDK